MTVRGEARTVLGALSCCFSECPDRQAEIGPAKVNSQKAITVKAIWPNVGTSNNGGDYWGSPFSPGYVCAS